MSCRVCTTCSVCCTAQIIQGIASPFCQNTSPSICSTRLAISRQPELKSTFFSRIPAEIAFFPNGDRTSLVIDLFLAKGAIIIYSQLKSSFPQESAESEETNKSNVFLDEYKSSRSPLFSNLKLLLEPKLLNSLQTSFLSQLLDLISEISFMKHEDEIAQCSYEFQSFI